MILFKSTPAFWFYNTDILSKSSRYVNAFSFVGTTKKMSANEHLFQALLSGQDKSVVFAVFFRAFAVGRLILLVLRFVLVLVFVFHFTDPFLIAFTFLRVR